MYSDAEVSVTSVPEISMQVEMLLRLAPVAKHGRAVRHSSALVDTRANITSGGEPEEVIVQRVTAQFFPIRTMQLRRFNGSNWKRLGGLLTAE